jgi:peptidoglycan/LPS O-acetylase OafA/YrhL
MTKLFKPSPDRLHGLDHLRAIAILLVMLFHFGRGLPSWLEPVKQIGWSGVDLFFVLSGYLIGYQLLKEINNTNKISFKRFYIKRFFRIIPVYLAVLILYYSVPTFGEGADLPPLWRFLTFTQNFGLDVQTQNSFSHAWSLCIEEQFYFLLPITIVGLFTSRTQKLTPYLMAGLLILGFILRFYNWNEYVQPAIDSANRRQMVFAFIEKIYYPSYNRMDGLIMGLAIAAIFNFKPKIKAYLTRHANIVLIIGIGIFLAAYKVCHDFISFNTAVFGFPLISFAYGLILMAAISPNCILYRFKTRFTFIMATLSYAIYLTHKPLYHLVKVAIEKTGNEALAQWTFWICILVATIGGLVLHLLIEKPFMNLRKKILFQDKETNKAKEGVLRK